MSYVTSKDGTQIFYKDWGDKSAQPIVFSHDCDAVDRIDMGPGKIQVSRHPAYYGQLLPVFLTEESHVGTDLIEQLADNRRDTIEMAGAIGPTEAFANT